MKSISKRKLLTESRRNTALWVDENGNLHVKNSVRFLIPELTHHGESRSHHPTVTGSYEGKGVLLKKLERIVAKNAQQKFEDEGADE